MLLSTVQTLSAQQCSVLLLTHEGQRCDSKCVAHDVCMETGVRAGVRGSWLHGLLCVIFRFVSWIMSSLIGIFLGNMALQKPIAYLFLSPTVCVCGEFIFKYKKEQRGLGPVL